MAETAPSSNRPPTGESVCRVAVWSVTGNQTSEQPDRVAVEEPVEIRLGFGPTHARQRETLSITMRTPGHDEDLAVGFLATETILRQPTELHSLAVGRGWATVELQPDVLVDPSRWLRHFYTSSSCGVCGKTSLEAVEAICDGPRAGGATVDRELIPLLADRLREAQPGFTETGGLHAAALFDVHGQLLNVREDVGRHNAVDKLLGAAFRLGQWPLHDRILFVSGRASFELVQKAAVAGVPIFAAVGAPSSLAVQLAKRFRMTLLGFVRDGRFNVYSGIERISSDKADEDGNGT